MRSAIPRASSSEASRRTTPSPSESMNVSPERSSVTRRSPGVRMARSRAGSAANVAGMSKSPTITDKIAKLTGEEPWSGYDEQSVDAIATALYETTTTTAREVKAYERDHQGRTGVIEAADRRIERN